MSAAPLAGRRALVTGSVRGLGLAAARGLADAGAAVVLNGRDAGSVADAAATLRGSGADVTGAAFDVTDRDATAAAVAGLGPLDVLVNNVGRRDRRGTFDLAPDDLAAMLHDHLVAAYALARLVATDMVRRQVPGRIVNISSVSGRLGRPGDAGYATAKAGVEGMTRALAADLGPHGVTVNAVAPGTFATEANAHLVADPGWAGWVRGRTALGRWGSPEEIAGAVVFLAGDGASYVTGQTICVDGGMSVGF